MRETDSRRITDHARSFVASNFAPREHGSGILAIVMFAFGALSIVSTASRVDPAQALYSAGLTGCAAGFIMVVGWGAAGGHGGVCLCTASVIATRAEQMDERFDEIMQAVAALNSRFGALEDTNREVSGAVRDRLSDEIGRRRGQN